MEKVNSTLNNAEHSRLSTQYEVVNFISIIGILVSIIFICIHLVVHLLSNKLHNLPGRNLASFCVSLLMEYNCILLSTLVEDYFCTGITTLINYFIMSSYIWMLIMSYETWNTIRISMKQCVLSIGNRWKRFYIYSAISWLVPALFLVLDHVVPMFIPAYAIVVDNKGCPMFELLTYIKEITLFLILFANSVFFGSSLYYIHVNDHSVRNLNATDGRFLKNFTLHMRLVLITGLTWTFEMLAFYSGLDVLSLAFQTINAFEGLFIAVAFTCRKQVLDSIKFLSCL